MNILTQAQKYLQNFLGPKAPKHILHEVVTLLEHIHQKYSDLDFNSGIFARKSETEKLGQLIKILNKDPLFRRFSRFSGIKVYNIMLLHREELISGHNEENLVLGRTGLYILMSYKSFNLHKRKEVTVVALRQFGVTCEILRKQIVEKTTTESYHAQLEGK